MNWRWLFLFPIIWACDDYNDCGISDYSEELYVAFYDAKDNGLQEVNFDSIRLTFSNGERILLSGGDETTGYTLPTDLTDTVMNYLFITDSAKFHLELTYNREAIIENPECGPIFRLKGVNAQSIEDAESTPFDSVAVQVLELTKLISPHVEVYF